MDALYTFCWSMVSSKKSICLIQVGASTGKDSMSISVQTVHRESSRSMPVEPCHVVSDLLCNFPSTVDYLSLNECRQLLVIILSSTTTAMHLQNSKDDDLLVSIGFLVPYLWRRGGVARNISMETRSAGKDSGVWATVILSLAGLLSLPFIDALRGSFVSGRCT